MPNHDQFEEMCALAAGGELGYEDLQKLKVHLDDCYPCRELLTELSEIHAQWLPERPDFEIQQDAAAGASLRRRILKHASRAGAHFSRSAQRTSPAAPSWHAAWQAPQAWIFAAAALFLLTVGAWASVQIFRSYATPPVVASLPRTVPATSVAPSEEQLAEINASRQKQTELETTIGSLKKQQSELETALKEQQKRADSVGVARADALQTIARLQQQLQDAQTSRAHAESALAQLKTAQASSDAVTIAQQQEIERLNQKLSDQAATVDRERQMLASGREIRDLIAARNLHIIDVYDTDARGKTTPAFGRVFYTEGKSLIFYAYDLGDGPRQKGDIAFYVWGKQDGAPQNVRKLGALVKDTNAQQRWVFTLTDPKVLAEIDSVFVTLEPGDKAERRPRGRRLLSAFLGSPANHP